MTKVVCVASDGTEILIEGDEGQSLMEVILNCGAPAMAADCGGALSCATCQVYIHADWIDRLEKPSEMEEAMLEFAHDPQPNSRLSCQIKLTHQIDGLVFEVAKAQF